MNGKPQELTMEKKPFDRSAHMKALNAKRTPESFEKSKEKRSIAMKKAWAKKGKKARIEVNRKISATQAERRAKTPPRARKEHEEKRINSIIEFYNKDTIDVQEHKEYLGYRYSRALDECVPTRRERIITKRTEGVQKKWDSLTHEEKEIRCANTIGKGHLKQRKIHLLYETDVPRKKTYCGVVTEQEMESMHG